LPSDLGFHVALSECLRELLSEISVANFQLGGRLLLERHTNSASLFEFIRLVQLHAWEEAHSFGEFAYLNMDFLGMCIYSAIAFSVAGHFDAGVEVRHGIKKESIW
jgi:hypothetical protein